MNIEQALLKVTDPNHFAISAPFNAEIDGQPCRIASDGAALLVVFGDYPQPDLALSDRVRGVIKARAEQTMTAGREAVIAWAGSAHRDLCSKCDLGMVSPTKCLECNGVGWRECDLGHEHDCEECEEGLVGEVCAACKKGYLNADIVPVEIDGIYVIFDAHRIGGVVDLLPSDQIGIGVKNNIATFYGDGWIMIVHGLTGYLESARVLYTD